MDGHTAPPARDLPPGPPPVSQEEFLLILDAYIGLHEGADQDTKAKVMFYMVRRHIRGFLLELKRQPQFEKVRQLEIGKFVDVMVNIAEMKLPELRAVKAAVLKGRAR